MLRWDEKWDIQFTAHGLQRAGPRSTTFWQRALEDHLSRPDVWGQVCTYTSREFAWYKADIPTLQQIPHEIHEHHPDTTRSSYAGDLYVHDDDYTVWTLNKNDFRPWHLGGLDPGHEE